VAGAIIGTGKGNVAYNNVLAFNGTGILVRGTGPRIYHNTIRGNETAGVDVSGRTNAEIKNNIIYQSSSITGRVKRGALRQTPAWSWRTTWSMSIPCSWTQSAETSA
jgi:hypothetical protein